MVRYSQVRLAWRGVVAIVALLVYNSRKKTSLFVWTVGWGVGCISLFLFTNVVGPEFELFVFAW